MGTTRVRKSSGPPATGTAIQTTAWRSWLLLGVAALAGALVAGGSPFPGSTARTPAGTLSVSLSRAFGLRFQPSDPANRHPARMVAAGGAAAVVISPDRLALSPRLRPARSPGAVSRSRPVEIRLAGARPHAPLVGESRLPFTTRRFQGSQPPGASQPPVPQFRRVRCRAAYPGIDVVYYGTNEELEFDFEVAPGAEVERVALAFPPDRRAPARLARDGRLEVGTGADRVVLERPVAYQEGARGREWVACRYDLDASGKEARFALGPYDPSRRLVIDPIVGFSNTLGGSGSESATGVALGPDGTIYLAGTTKSPDFPTTPGLPTEPGGAGFSEDGFIVRLDPSGTTVLAATYLGGTAQDLVAGLETDAAGNVYVVGRTSSIDFPYTGSQALSTSIFVASLTPDLSQLRYTRFFTSSREPSGFAVAPDGSTVVSVNSTVSFDPPSSWIRRLSSSGQTLTFERSFPAAVRALACDASGNTYLTGWGLNEGQATPGAYDQSQDGVTDAFVARLDPAGATSYATFLGGSDQEEGLDIDVDSLGRAHVLGFTGSIDFPLLDAAQPAKAGSYEGFVTRLNASGSVLSYSTYLGGSAVDFWATPRTRQFGKIAVADGGSILVTGTTDSFDFPLLDPIGPAMGGGTAAEMFVVAYNALGARQFSTRFGYSVAAGRSSGDPMALAVDGAGAVYVAGNALTHFPRFGVPPTTEAPGDTAFCFKLSPGATPLEPPLPPHALSLHAEGMTRVEVAWSDPNSNEEGFRVERKVDGGDWEVAGAVGANVREFQDENLTPATGYAYRVYAFNSAGASAYSQERTTVTASFYAPYALRAERSSNTAVTLFWTDFNTFDAHTWELERSAAGEPFAVVATGVAPASPSSYVETPPSRERLYTYRLRFRMGGLTTAYSDPAFVRAGEGKGKLVVSPRRLSFGSVRVGRTVRRTIILRNTGRAGVLINVVGYPGQFSIESGAGRRVLLPRQSLKVIVAFTPATAGAWADQVDITCDTPANKEVQVLMRATSRP